MMVLRCIKENGGRNMSLGGEDGSRNTPMSPVKLRWKLVRNTVKAVTQFQTTNVQNLISDVLTHSRTNDNRLRSHARSSHVSQSLRMSPFTPVLSRRYRRPSESLRYTDMRRGGVRRTWRGWRSC